MKKYNIENRIQEVLNLEYKSILLTSKKINKKQINVVVNRLLNVVKSGGRLAISGIGKNYSIAHKISSTFNSLNIPSYHFDSFHALHGDLGSVCMADGVIYLSRSGNTREMLATASYLKGRVYQVAITCNKNSLISDYVDDHVSLPFKKEADNYDLVPTCSSTLLLSVGDSLGIVMSEMLGVTKADFYRNHPEGSLGERLKKELKYDEK